MRKIIVLLLVASFFFCPWVKATCAGQIQVNELSQAEVENLAAAEADSTCTVSSVVGGDETGSDEAKDETKKAAGLVLLIVVIIVIAVAATY